jgi:hypothetical protein
MLCATCRQNIDQGRDAYSVQKGVIGTRGFIPLDDSDFYCSVECVRDNFRASAQVSHRIP